MIFTPSWIFAPFIDPQNKITALDAMSDNYFNPSISSLGACGEGLLPPPPSLVVFLLGVEDQVMYSLLIAS